MSDEKTIVVVEPTPLGIPMMPIEQLKELTAYVNQVKKALMVEGKDYVKDGNRQYTARSGFAKLHQGFFLSDAKAEIIKLYEDEPVEYTFKHFIRRRERAETFTTNLMGFEAYVTVINVDTGRHASGEGACTIAELSMTDNLSPKWYHRALGTAKTRAWNRAVSNYVGSAEVSAEERGLRYEDESPPSKTPPRKEPAKDVKVEETPRKVVDFMKPVELRVPDVALIDELNRAEDNWDIAETLTREWMIQANMNPEDFNIAVDPMKLTVVPRKRIPDSMKSGINGIMIGGGLQPTKVKRADGYRMNKKDVTD